MLVEMTPPKSKKLKKGPAAASSSAVAVKKEPEKPANKRARPPKARFHLDL